MKGVLKKRIGRSVGGLSTEFSKELGCLGLWVLEDEASLEKLCCFLNLWFLDRGFDRACCHQSMKEQLLRPAHWEALG